MSAQRWASWFLCLLVAAAPLPAATFIVETLANDLGDNNPGDGKCEWATLPPPGERCTLRAAVQEANALPGADLILIPDGWRVALSRTGAGEDAAITGDLDILDDVTIGSLAPPSAWPVIDAQQLDRVFDVHFPNELTLAAVALTGGSTAQNGGAVLVRAGGALDASNCRLDGNAATQSGGAVYVGLGATAEIDRCSVQDNRSGSHGTAFWSVGSLTVSNSAVWGNRELVPGSQRHAIHNRGFMTLRNTTVAENAFFAIVSSDFDQAPHSLTLLNVTVVGNGLGLSFIDTDSFASPNIRNSILAHNGGQDCFIEAGAADVAGNHNLDSDGTCGLNGAASDLPATDPMLGVLQVNGGTTRSMVPRVGSPVIDAGKTATCQTVDQRGAARPLDGDGAGGAVCDIGAVEVLPCDKSPADAVLSHVMVTPPGGLGEACFTIAVGPAVEILGGAVLALLARDLISLGNGVTVRTNGELQLVLHAQAGSTAVLSP